MSHDAPDEPQEQPTIRFGDDWLPAHEAWGKLETANAVADTIDRFNERFPQLASRETRDVVPLVRQRLKDIELRMPEKAVPRFMSMFIAAPCGSSSARRFRCARITDDAILPCVP